MTTKIVIVTTVQHPDEMTAEDAAVRTMECMQRNVLSESQGRMNAEEATVFIPPPQ